MCVEEKHLLSANSNSETMTVHSVQCHSHDSEDCFQVTVQKDGIPNPMQEVQQAR